MLAEDGRCETILGDRYHPPFGAPFNNPADAGNRPTETFLSAR